MSLEDIERKFYSQPIQEKKEAPSEEDSSMPKVPASAPSAGEQTSAAAPDGKAAPSPWAEAARGAKGKIGKALVIAVVALVVLAGVGGGIYALTKFFGSPSEAVASVDIYAPLQTQRGVPFEARVEVRNETEKPLSGTLRVSLSHGLLGSGGELLIEEEVSDIPPQSAYEKLIPLYAVGDVGANEKLSAEFSAGAEPVIEEKEIYIRESGIRISAERRQIPGENSKFEITVRYENISGVVFKDAAIEVRYPSAFSYLSASPAPSEGKGVWRLGEVKNRAEGTITIQGTLSQGGAASVGIPVSFTTRVAGEEFTLAEASALLSASQSPVLVSVIAGGKEDYVARQNIPVSYSFRVKNNTEAGLSDVVVLISLDGAMYDFSKVSTQGTYNSSNHTVRFTAAQAPKLRALAPGDTAELLVTAGVMKDFPLKTENDKNFLLKGTVEVTSPTVPHNSTADKTFVSVPFSHKVQGAAEIIAAAWRKDPWGIVNGGTLPLAPGKPIEYTIHWTVKNYATDIRDMNVKSALAPGVRFTGVVRSNAPTSPQVNDRTGLVTWALPLVPAGKGVVNSAYETVFQVEATPNITQVGKRMELLGPTELTGTDAWTSTEIADRFDKVDSSIPHDPTFKTGDDLISK